MSPFSIKSFASASVCARLGRYSCLLRNQDRALPAEMSLPRDSAVNRLATRLSCEPSLSAAPRQRLRDAGNVPSTSKKTGSMITSVLKSRLCKFAATHERTVKEGIDLLAREYGKLKEPWVFV